jgi:hypothetical protein
MIKKFDFKTRDYFNRFDKISGLKVRLSQIFYNFIGEKLSVSYTAVNIIRHQFLGLLHQLYRTILQNIIYTHTHS